MIGSGMKVVIIVSLDVWEQNNGEISSLIMKISKTDFDFPIIAF